MASFSGSFRPGEYACGCTLVIAECEQMLLSGSKNHAKGEPQFVNNGLAQLRLRT